MKYDLIENSTAESMVDEINKMIKKGWEPLGGISISEVEGGGNYYKAYVQAMIKKRNNNPLPDHLLEKFEKL